MKRLLWILSLVILLAALCGPAWAVTISDFPEETSPGPTDVVPVEDGVTTSKMTLATLASHLPAITTPSITLTGTPLALDYGGLGADLSAYDGLVKVSSGAASQVSLPLAVANGGWGLNTLTPYSLYTGNGTSSPVAVGVGTTGQILGGVTGDKPIWLDNLDDGALPLGGTWTLTSGLTITGGSVTWADNFYALFGTGADLQIYHSGTNSYLQNATGTLYVQGDALSFRSITGTEPYITATLNGAVTLYYDAAVALATAAAGQVNIGTDDNTRGRVDLFGGGAGSTTGGVLYLYTPADYDGSIQFYNIWVYQDDLQLGPNTDPDSLIYNGSAARWQFNSHAQWMDNMNAYFGDGIDLSIRHDGSNSYVANATGDLYIDTTGASGGNIYLRFAGEIGVAALKNSGVALYFDNAVALTTTGSGQVSLGIDDTQSGHLNLYGKGAGETQGGKVLWYLAADYDTSFNYYIAQVTNDDWTLGSSATPSKIKISGEGNFIWNSGSQGATAAGMIFLANGNLPTTFPNAGIGADAGEVKVWDTSGNITTISPHAELDRFAEFYSTNPNAVPWTFTSRNPYTGKYQIINMGALVAAVEALTGQKFTTSEAVSQQDWSADQSTIKGQIDAERTAARTAKVNDLVARRQAAEVAILVATSQATRDAVVVARAADLQATYGESVPVLGEEGEVLEYRTPTQQAELEVEPALTKDEALAQVDVATLRAQAESEIPAIEPYQIKAPPAWLAQQIAAMEAAK